MKISRCYAVLHLLAFVAAFVPLAASAAPMYNSGYSYGSGGSNSTASYGSGHKWGGAYAGIHVGMAWGDFTGGSATVAGPDGDDSAGMGGAQIGYNWQRDRIVYGGEADFSFVPLEGKSSSGSLEQNWTSTLRARAGYSFDKWLPYATLGLAVTNADSKTAGGSTTNTHVGFAFGAGVDYAVFDKLSWRAEYLRIDVPEEYDTINGSRFNGGGSNNVIRIGANYRFY